jgi:hypothetical protein
VLKKLGSEMKTFGVLAGASVMALATISGAEAAPSVLPIEETHAETRFMAGVQWNFGSSTPELVLGVRRIKTRNNDSTIGGKFDIAIPLNADTYKTPVVRLMGVAGNRDVQGEFGFGLKLMEWKAVVGVGVQAPYTNGGVNYIFNDGLNPYFGFNTLKKPTAP